MGDGCWIKTKTLAVFPDVTAEIFYVTPVVKLNDSPGNRGSADSKSGTGLGFFSI